ncbi:glutamine synthetase family protein [Oceanicoccus sp. KOV_DT_Chl]|uniref:glutamine synthetase family protein n=1 Tax=Oceanicoccus sp. KOV_DT_Chl TaxID=1904639 RepID=UPI000C7E34A7|nr:glutamine synthetase family protein [Oceanicoccus sp. KOV_DT_Chl]
MSELVNESASPATLFLEQNPTVKTIDLLLCDLNGILRGKRIGKELLPKVFAHGFYLPRSVMGLGATGDVVPDTNLGLKTGDSDRLCCPVVETLALQPWRERKDRAQVLCSMLNIEGAPFFADTRQVLTQVVDRFAKLGYTPGLALELEFYLFDKVRDEKGRLQQPKSPVSGRRMTTTQVYAIDDLEDYDFFIEEVLSMAAKQNIPADTVIAENAPGQFEVNLDYGNDILKAVDQAVLLKRLIRTVARRHNMEASFMAKPYIDQPGNGLHIHLSLLDAQGNNIFATGEPTENPFMRQAIAGLLDMADSTQALICPTVNSFRRLAAGECVPTSKTWGFDNRSVALRIPASGGKATRLECRTAGADANPYLATAALLMGVAEGLNNKLTPPEPVVNNAYEQEHPQLADNQRDALRNMDSDPRIADWLGEDFVKMYSIAKHDDMSLFERQVTALEYELLFPYI